MAKNQAKRQGPPVRPQLGDNVEILSAGSVLEQPITETLETNYMPYAMSVIVSVPCLRSTASSLRTARCLYTMYDMGLLKARTKAPT